MNNIIKKTMLLAAGLIVFCLAANAQGGRTIYQRYSDMENVNAVYVSPSMFRIIGRIPDLNLPTGDVNLVPLIKTLNGLYLINSRDAGISKNLMADAMNFVRSGKFELMMEMKEDGNTAHIYTPGKNGTVSNFVFLSLSGSECTFISLDGQMPEKELEDLLGKAIANL